MKTFFLWLAVQLAFARILFGLALYTWAELRLPADYIGYFIIPTMFVCVVETIVSAVLLFNVWKLQARIANGRY